MGGGAEDVRPNGGRLAAAPLLPPTAPVDGGRWLWSGSLPDGRRAAAAAAVGVALSAAPRPAAACAGCRRNVNGAVRLHAGGLTSASLRALVFVS